MTPNLTEEQRLVRRLAEVAPVPGCHVVVFETLSTGRRFHGTLEPGETLRVPLARRLFGGGNGYSAYAVAADRTRELGFSFFCPAWKGTGPITVQASLHYAVASPRLVAELLDTDPLDRLSEEIKNLARRAVARLKLARIEAGEVDVESEILTSQSSDDHGEPLPHLEIIRNFAPKVGLKVNGLRLVWSLPSDTTKFAEDELDIHRKEGLSRVQDEVLRQQEWRKQEQERQSRLAREQLESDARNVQRLREELDARSKAMQKALVGAVEAMNVAMLKPAERIETVGELRQALRELVALQREAIVLGGTENAVLPAALSGAPGTFLLPAPDSASKTPLSELLDGLLRLARSLPVEADGRRRLISASLHVVAEALLAERADGDLLEQSREVLQGLFHDLVRADALPSNEERKLLARLLDPVKLRSELGSEAAV